MGIRSQAARQRSTFERRDAYDVVTDRIIAALERGVAPWVRPWRSLGPAAQLRNAVSGRPYRGINVLLLGSAGYEDPRWLTYRQAQGLGGHVRKGEKSTPAVFWKRLVVRDRDEETGEEGARVVPLLRYYSLFNAGQCDGLALEPVGAPLEPILPPNGECSEFIARTGAEIRHGGDVAAYNLGLDLVTLPAVSSFVDVGAYFATAFHELTHWTGHPSRTPRPFGRRFGSEAYAAEELVAELGSAFLCERFRVDGRLQHPEYLGNWLTVLRGDNRAIVTAASKARIACEWLYAKTGTTPAAIEEEETAEAPEGATA